ncbi:unnamed protein product [Linum trigynum]|uniref:ABC transporter domain-containing protein n=1 Tax=Linum trigynum TaxID=586398 RepID=A0AAV2EGT6_9ROSI
MEGLADGTPLKDLQNGDHDLLFRLENVMDRAGIELPTVEVRFEHLNVEGKARPAGRALPSLYNVAANMLEDLLSYLHIIGSRKRQFPILKDLSGVLKPSRMVLLLGPPSSGKTTLLNSLAGLEMDPSLKVSGKLTYNGHTTSEFVPQRTAAYIGQHDNHIGELTVRETLAFSARCQGTGFLSEVVDEVLRTKRRENLNVDDDVRSADMDMFMKTAGHEGQRASLMIDHVLKILGMEECADTLVGSIMSRGISGGQKKRLTIGEMLVGGARVMLMDEISNGLDASTTFQIVNYMRRATHVLNGTTLISLLQPTPECYQLFDDVLLLSQGRIVYHGRREDALRFFHHLGFTCPRSKNVPDFLHEVISKKDQRQYWARDCQPYRYFTVKEFAEAYRSFSTGEEMREEELSQPFDDKKEEHRAAGLSFLKHGASEWELLKACISREFMLMKRNSYVYVFKILQLIIMAVVIGTLFLRTEMKRETAIDGLIYMGAMFFIVIMILFNGMADLSIMLPKLPVFYKQRKFRFYPPWAFSLPPCLLHIPIIFLEVAAFVPIPYYMIGFDPQIARLLKQYFLLVLVSQMSGSMFRFIGSIGRNETVSSTLSAFILLVLLTMSGFVLSRDRINKLGIWGYWISPFMYADNAILVNEFLGDNWNQGASFSTGTTLGTKILKFRGFFADPNWYWIGVLALLAFTIIFQLGFALALTFLNPFGRSQAFISEDSEGDKGSNPSKNGSVVTFDTVALDDDNVSRKQGVVVLPFEPRFVTFEDITYVLDTSQGMIEKSVVKTRSTIIKGVSGAFRPGLLTALMGVTGAGKTTLLDVLAGRKTRGQIQGEIRINGYPKKQNTFARISGYCEQNDIHSPFVTVHESLLYSAWLRLPSEVDFHTRMMFVEEVIALVELNSLRHLIVGLPGINGLSIEQRKRLTIAVELVANPSIIFMDEPTSGLDARAAAIVMRTVRNAVDTGRTIVCTIHQPSMDIFESFDQLFLLNHGGEEIYVGPIGRKFCHLIKYFEGIQGVSKIKDGYNPATWMLEISTPRQEEVLGVDFAMLYKKSDLYKRNKVIIKELSSPVVGSRDLYFPTRYHRSTFTQCAACLWKFHLSYSRNLPYTGVRFLFTVIIAFLFGGIYWDLGGRMETEQDLFNAIGSMFTAIFSIGIQNATTVQSVVDIERTVFYRERAARMYAAFPYALSQVLIELPYMLLQTVVYCIIVYPMIGFEYTLLKCFWFWFFMYFTLLYFTFYGMMTVSFTPNQQIGYIVSTAFYGLWNLFAGFIIPQPRAPVWWRWYFYVCPVSWTFYGVVASQYGDVKTTFPDGLTVEGFVKLYFGFEHHFVGVVGIVVVGFGVLFISIFSMCIMLLNFQKR